MTPRRSRLQVWLWAFSYFTRPIDDKRLDPFGVIATLAAEVLDHNLLERAATREPVEIFELRCARYAFKSVAPTCSRVPELERALKEASAAMHALRTILKDPEQTDFASYVETGRAAAQRIRDLLAQHTVPATPTAPAI